MKNRLLHSAVLTFLVIIIAASCSKNVYPEATKVTILYPAPPDTARIQFLTRYATSTDFTGNQSKFKTFVAGKEEPKIIKKPYGIALREDRIFIADPDIAGLHIIDLKNNSYDYFLPPGRGKLVGPINCNFDWEGYLYVADTKRQQVVVFNENLEYIGEIGGSGNFKPTDVFIYGDTILITDPTNNRVNAYDRSSRGYLFSFPENAAIGDDEWLYNPLNLWISNKTIYVTDFGNSRVKVFDMHGKFQRSIGSFGRGLGQFVRPKGIALDQEENLYVIDAGFQNAQIFNKSDQLLMAIGGPYSSQGDMYLPANVTIDYDHLDYFEKYVDPAYKLKYLIFVTNQYGPDKVNVYGRVESK